MGSTLMAALAGRPAHFVTDARFAAEQAAAQAHARIGAAAEPDAWQLGYTAGFAAAQAEEERQMREAGDTREKLRLAFTRLDACAQQVLAEQLAETVAGLCEDTLAPFALDGSALQQRCDAAAAVLSGVSGRLTLRLNPADLPLLDPDVAVAWNVVADDVLARGSLRLENEDGGIADDPASWSAQLRGALRGC